MIMPEEYPRLIDFDSVLNFRDLGGYQTEDGYQVCWRRIYRSGELHKITTDGLARLRDEIGMTTVLNLRSPEELETGEIDLLRQAGIQYHVSVPFIGDSYDRNAEKELFANSTHMGPIYLYIIGQEGFGNRLAKALDLVAEPANHPLVFHCAVGKDRTGILAAVVLGILGVSDEDIIEDYTLTAHYMEKYLERLNRDPGTADILEKFPDYVWEASPESMSWFLNTLKRTYGTMKNYAKSSGVTASCIERLRRTLLI